MDEAGTQTLPQGQRYIIKRPRLTKLLDESKARIIMLLAAAGYGKTTLAREWLETRDHGWYRGVPASSDVAALAVGLAEAAGTIVPGAGKRMRERLRVTSNPERDVEPLAELLAEDLAAWPQQAWLAIDDYHFAAESPASEQFVELVTTFSPVNLLVMSRKHPAWGTPRQVLYGEVLELTATQLALSDQEASQVLAARATEAPGFIASAAGWPAVIGLAALTGETALPASGLPTTLYAYLAQELYAAAAPADQWALCQISLVPSITRPLVEWLLDSEALRVLRAGVELGFLVPVAPEKYDLHPLLRTFLRVKLHEHSSELVDALARRLARYFVARSRWDDAFSVIQQLEDDEALFIEFLEAALQPLVRAGRVSTLTDWLATASRRSLDAAVVDLIEAELAFRDADRARAETLAVQAGRRFNDQSPLKSHAFFLAGASAHLLDKNQVGRRYHEIARSHATTDDDAFQALWGELTCATAAEQDDARLLLERLGSFDLSLPDRALRVITAHMVIEYFNGSAGTALEYGESGAALLSRVANPMIRTSFTNFWAHLLVVAGQYSKALELVDAELIDATNYRLAFVQPHALTVKASAHLGYRHFRRAFACLARAEASFGHADLFARVHGGVVTIRLHLALGDIDRALAVPVAALDGTSVPGIEAERLASRALALAVAGRSDEAVAAANAAESMTKQLETRALAPWVRAVVDVLEGHESAAQTTERAMEITRESGNVDALVACYRAAPPLLAYLARTEHHHDLLAQIAVRARDVTLAAAAGIPLREAKARSDLKLSRRELEVYELLAQGMSNREIAEALFITQTTVKVHVRHIYEKLGVRSRAELAARAGRDDDL